MRKELYSLSIAFCMLFCLPAFAATTWNGTTWSDGAPNTSVDAIIASNVSPGAFSCANLTINNGFALTIDHGVTVTVAGNLTNNGNGLAGTGTIQFNNNGNTLQLSGNAISFEGILDVVAGTTLSTNNLLTLGASTNLSYGRITASAGAITGNVTVEKVLSNTNAGWRQISFPVSATVGSLTGVDLRTASHPNLIERNIFYWNANAGAPGPITGNYAVGWTAPQSTDNDVRAYTIYSDNDHEGPYDISPTISVTGVLNQDSRVFNLQYTFDPASSGTISVQRGWNFIPNPFAGNIDVYTMVNDVNFGSTYKAVHVYNAQTGQYTAINQSSRVNYNTPDMVGIVPRHKVMPFQGFWVKATSVSQSITVKRSFLSTDDISSSNVIAMNAPSNLLRLNVSDYAGRGDQIAVFFDANATAELDGTMDMLKFKSPDKTVPTLYCREGEMELCANALPPVNGSRSVQLMFETHKPNGTVYTFLPDLSAFQKNAVVHLEDRKTGQLHDFTKGKYEFVYDESFGADRFVLHFMQSNDHSNLDQSPSLTKVK